MFYSPKRKDNYDNKNKEEENNNNEDNKNETNDLNKIENEQNETRCEKIEFQNQIYILNFGYITKNNSLFLELTPKSIDSLENYFYYKGTFIYNDLTKLCKAFKMYDSIQEIFSSFCIIFENKKVFLKINENNSFDIVLLVNSITGKEEEVCFPLERHNIMKDNISKSNDKWEEKEKELNAKIENLEKNLRQENYELKNEIYYLKNDVDRYVKTIDNNKKEIKNLKEQIKNIKNMFEQKIKELNDKINLNNINNNINNINNDLTNDNITNNSNDNKDQNEPKFVTKNINPKSQKEVKATEISKKNNNKIHSKNNSLYDNQKKISKSEKIQNKSNKTQEEMKKNKREIYKQMKEENAKKLNLNKVKPSFSEFLRQKKLKDSTNTNNKQLTKSYTSTGNNFLKNNNIEEKIIDEQYKENFEEEYESEKEKNINDSQEENIINENENVRYKNLSDKGEEKEEYIDGENDDLATKKTNEVSRSYIIDEWTKDFNLNVKKLLEDNDIKLRFTEKLNYMNRRIISKVEELQLIENQILKEHPNIKNIEYDLIYRGSENGDSAKVFHEKCNVPNNLILIKTEDRTKFGGYTKESWEGENISKKDKNAFCFCLNKNKIYKVDDDKTAIYCNENMGPCFGDKFFQILDNYLTEGGICFEKDNCGYIDLENDFEITNGNKEFLIEELEVYKLKFNY